MLIIAEVNQLHGLTIVNCIRIAGNNYISISNTRDGAIRNAACSLRD